MDRLSAIVIYRSDDDQVEKCIRSLQDIADETILLDPNNYIKSLEIVKQFKIKHFPGDATGLTELLEKAAEMASFDRLFFIGSNEYLSESLRRSIREIKENWDTDGYSVSRFMNYYGKWLRHSGLYPDQPVRLYKKSRGYWTGEQLEEHIKLKEHESADLVKGDLYCTVFKNIQEHIANINQATHIEATKSFKKGKKVNSLQIIFLPLKYFLKQYFIKLGILDGFYGFVFRCVVSGSDTLSISVELTGNSGLK